jgi:hypothetical protein
MKPFWLERIEDESGISGVSRVIEGILELGSTPTESKVSTAGAHKAASVQYPEYEVPRTLSAIRGE